MSSTPFRGKATYRFGAIGDHLKSTKTSSLSSKKLPVVQGDPLINSAQPSFSAVGEKYFPLADLLIGSTPDEDTDRSLTVRENEHCRQHATQLEFQKSFRGTCSSMLNNYPRLPDLNSSAESSQFLIAPIWHRAGRSLRPTLDQVTAETSHPIPSDLNIDPDTFQLPFGVSTLHSGPPKFPSSYNRSRRSL